jgi:hypothetical protein
VVPENDCFAIGINGLNEKSPGEGLRNDYLSVSFAYQKGLDNEGKQQLGVGFQTTLGRKRIDPPQLFFEDQVYAWMQSGFMNIDVSLLNSVDVSYLDLNVGVVYQGRFNAKNFFTAGASFHHANKPDKIFQGGQLLLNRQFGGHIAWENCPSVRKKIYSFFLVSIPKTTKQTIATGIIYQSAITAQNYFVNAGLMFRSSWSANALTPMFGLKFRDFLLNFSYDVPLSNKGFGNASEVSLVYTNAVNRVRFLENKFIRY